MKVSVIVPTFNRYESVKRCLATLLDQDLPHEHYEIVIVNDGSTDGSSLSDLQFPKNVVVLNHPENRGLAAARNTGARAAKGRLLLFIDDDMSCDRRLVPSHLAAHANGAFRKVVFGKTGTAFSGSHTFASEATAVFLDQHYRRLERDPVLKWPDDAWVGQNCSIERSTFLDCGGYDDIRFARRFEETELGMRLWKGGVGFYFEPRAIVWHSWTKANEQVWEDFKLQGASIVKLCRMYPELRPVWGYVGVVSASFWKRFAARILATAPGLAKTTLGSIVTVFERMPDGSWFRVVGSRIYVTLGGIIALSAARREAGSWRELVRLFGPTLPILLYHHIGSSTPLTRKNLLTVRPAKFHSHIRWLRWLGYTPITPAQWLAWRQAGTPIPDKPVLLTFDDAYADIAKFALPVLQQYEFSAAIFVITKLRSWEGLSVMSEEEIRYWAARGMSFGAHTRTHADLTAVFPDALRAEVMGSKMDLADIGVTAASFAYPYGCYDKQVRLAVADHFQIAFTCEKGVNDLRTDPLLLRRTIVHPSDNLFDIVLRLRFGWSPRGWLTERLIALLRRIGIGKLRRYFGIGKR